MRTRTRSLLTALPAAATMAVLAVAALPAQLDVLRGGLLGGIIIPGIL